MPVSAKATDSARYMIEEYEGNARKAGKSPGLRRANSLLNSIRADGGQQLLTETRYIWPHQGQYLNASNQLRGTPKTPTAL
jgi:hypothetical protein